MRRHSPYFAALRRRRLLARRLVRVPVQRTVGMRHRSVDLPNSFRYITALVPGEGYHEGPFSPIERSVQTCGQRPLATKLLVTDRTPICRARQAAGLEDAGYGVVAREAIRKGQPVGF